MKRALFLLAFLWLTAWAAAGQDRPVRIGVLANRGPALCMAEWNATAAYLTRSVPGNVFRIIPLSFEEVDRTVERGEVDFVVLNPSMYVELEARRGVSRIATMRVLRLGHGQAVFGGVIFHRADRQDIRSVADLKGKRFVAVDDSSLGGWRAVWGRLKREGLDPFRDFRILSFAGTHDNVVQAVRDGSADAGAVRTDTLERMQAEGKINGGDFTVLSYNGRGVEYENFPFALSTPLYPEWPMAKARNTPEELARRVAGALLAMPGESPAAVAAHIQGWTVPLNYQAVDELLRFLKVGPYQDLGRVTLAALWDQHWALVAAVVVALILAGLGLGLVARLNRSLGRARAALERELGSKEDLLNQLSLAHAEMSLIFNTSAGGMRVLGLDGTILRVNDAFCRISGWSREEAVGRHCCEIFTGSTCHSQDCTLEKVRKKGDRESQEMIKVRKDGTAISCEMVAAPLFTAEGRVTAIIQEFRDVTERRRFQNALEAKNLFLAAMIEALPEPFFHKDSEGRYQMVNKAFADLFGQDPEDILGRTVHELEPPEAALAHAALDRGPLDQVGTGVRVVETVIVGASGTRHTVLLRRAKVEDGTGRAAGIIGLVVDITERKRLEALREDVERLTRHDLKTPLGGIIALPEILLARSGMTPEQREILGLIRESGLRMLSMINLSLDLFKMEQGTYRLVPAEVELLRLTRSILTELNLHVRGKTLSVDLLVEGGPATGDQVFVVLGEELLLYCLLSNLIKNALEAAPRGSLVAVALSRADEVRIEVRNQGAVPEDIRATFFDKYVTRGKLGGTGLGTYSVRLIAEVHGGSVAMHTSEEEGTVVIVRLPLIPPPGAGAARREA